MNSAYIDHHNKLGNTKSSSDPESVSLADLWSHLSAVTVSETETFFHDTMQYNIISL